MKMSASIDLVTCSLSVPIPWAASPVPVTQATKAMVSPARVSFFFTKNFHWKIAKNVPVLIVFCFFFRLNDKKKPKSQFFNTKRCVIGLARVFLVGHISALLRPGSVLGFPPLSILSPFGGYHSGVYAAAQQLSLDSLAWLTFTTFITL